MYNKEQTPSINQEAAITPQKYYNEKIKFIEKHWAFISSLLVALIVFINFLFKVFEFSKDEAMYIDRSWIDFDSQYVIYSLMKSCLFIFAFATYNYLIYNVITKKNKKARTIALIICFILLTGLIQFGYFIIITKINPFELYDNNKIQFWAFIVATLIAAVLIPFLGIFYSIEKLTMPSKKTTSIKMPINKRNVILAFIAVFTIIISYLYALDLGTAAASSKKEFKTYDKYVVLAEDGDKLLCTEIGYCDEVEGEKYLVFDCKKQFIVTADPDIPITVQSYDKVQSNSKTIFDFITEGWK
ncbi:hypothetical protein [Ruminococcus sp.]|jgi:hypothetical protein|uniref:hypothetical protein n=1 Tax=Ruminococcus sp. TaxID=41978 RepID=UPI0025E9B9E3|nr:hypothetical protein [Ruminococcus sp.]